MPNPATSSPAVMQALQRRGMGANAGALSQVSPGARMANPVPQPANPSQMPNMPMPSGSQGQKFTPQTQDDMIVMALIEKLKNSGKAQQQGQQAGIGGGGAQDYLGHKMPILMNEHPNMKPDQAAAIAYSMHRKGMGGGAESKSPKQEQANYPFGGGI